MQSDWLSLISTSCTSRASANAFLQQKSVIPALYQPFISHSFHQLTHLLKDSICSKSSDETALEKRSAFITQIAFEVVRRRKRNKLTHMGWQTYDNFYCAQAKSAVEIS